MKSDLRSVQYHINCARGDVGKYIIMPGDPARCDKIAAYFDNAEFVTQNREYRVFTGTVEGEKVSAVSTGIGGPSAAIAMEELCNIGAEHFIRIGTCGGIAMPVKAGDLVIAMSAVRQDGTSYGYAPEGYPATADFNTVSALKNAAEKLNAAYHIGVVQAKDSFYGQHSPEKMPVSDSLIQKWNSYKKLGVLASEMESAALFTVAAYRNVTCGSVFSVVWNQECENAGIDDNECHDTDLAVRCAVEALREMILNNRK